MEFPYSRRPHSGAVRTGSYEEPFWNIGIWNIECLLWWNFYIPENRILEPFVQDLSNELSGIQVSGL